MLLSHCLGAQIFVKNKQISSADLIVKVWTKIWRQIRYAEVTMTFILTNVCKHT